LTKNAKTNSIGESMQISAVIPIFNEEKNIPELYKRLKPVLTKISKEHEIIFVNDGSRDKSLNILKAIRARDKKVKIISFSRNFGHMAALDAGLALASGKKTVIMDADLQDPPEVIERMYKKAKSGFDVVYGIKKERKENFIMRSLFKSFYRILNSISTYKMPLDAGTFSIIDKKVLNILTSLPEKNKYFSGLRAWIGFTQTGVVYKREARFAGKPANLKRLIKLALDGFISFSYLPLRIASILGFIFAMIAFAFIFVVFVLRIFFHAGIVGWASTMSAILLIGGVQLITLGIIGEYLARIYDEVKGRPEYIISEKIGFRQKN
jgi:dolichol-phosphate mannosyltransferase